MKVGVLTLHDGINYGAYWQVYALRKYIELLEHECEVINYKNLGWTLREYYWVFFRVKIQSGFLHRLKYDFYYNWKKVRKFWQCHKELNLTKRLFRQSELQNLQYDAVVFGSDEIWNFQSEIVKRDDAYFGKGLEAGRLVSYAPSFGGVQAENGIPEDITKLLKRFDSLSARDNNSLKIIKKHVQAEVKHVLDPTFLYSFDSEAKLPTEDNFIIAYGFFEYHSCVAIRNFANKIGKKLISVSYDNSWWVDVNLSYLHPREWLGYFMKADFVITSMFHGMIFSILNQQKFAFFQTPYRKNKVGRFLHEIGFEHAYWEEREQLEEIYNSSFDYEKANSVIGERKKISEQFLIDSLA